MADSMKTTSLVGRWGVPDDVAGAVVFFASDESSFITGQNININGGISIG
jgi:NAD(P)-dependent dehydrogenase (short-subunit alcohol dehydrogenase family)